jgi:MFS family permease
MTMYHSALTHGRKVAKKITKEPARPTVVRDHRFAPWFIVATVCFGAFMGQLDASIVTLAFPALERYFHTSLANIQWVSLAYLITLVVLLVPVGRFSDRVGRKLVYLYGFVVFTIASALCAIAPSLSALIVFRVLQAVGAAMLQANSVALVAMSVSGPKKRAALGIQAAAQSLGLTLGPVLGGLLVSTAGWQSIFLINVPVGIIASVSGWFFLPRTKERTESQQSDLLGIVLVAVSAISLLTFISGISGLKFQTIELVALAAITALSALGLWRHEYMTPHPLIDIRALTSNGTAGQLLGALCAYMVLFGPLVLFTQVMVSSGVSVLKTGILLGALPLGFGLAAVGGEYVFPSHWPDHIRARVGSVLTIASALLLTMAGTDTLRLLFLALLGLGLGVYIPANNATIMAAAPRREAATIGGMVNIARGLGTAFGVAVVTLALGLVSSRIFGQVLAMLLMALAAAGMFLANKNTSSGSRQLDLSRESQLIEVETL